MHTRWDTRVILHNKFDMEALRILHAHPGHAKIPRFHVTFVMLNHLCKWNVSGFRPLLAKLGQENLLLRMVRWVGWHCPPDTRFEMQTLEVWDRARYLSVTEAPHQYVFSSGVGIFVSNRRDRETNPELWGVRQRCRQLPYRAPALNHLCVPPVVQ